MGAGSRGVGAQGAADAAHATNQKPDSKQLTVSASAGASSSAPPPPAAWLSGTPPSLSSSAPAAAATAAAAIPLPRGFLARTSSRPRGSRSWFRRSQRTT